ncbi:subtilase-type protease inhibitor [Kibdelosporangium philippinense]|uniref:Subtilase-type protease inhibitor n=1 Tax=Kibdelosporangium philippinense TaxID=211113 RepID=A0ABS8Z6A7_9PSEU|nr:SSI family serine proteinase inhibitor [Kibdelosporangium philippinense]MCE7002103.1 subtilase-type protease inhibitor [Kibdelosporangium philippinense]
MTTAMALCGFVSPGRAATVNQSPQAPQLSTELDLTISESEDLVSGTMTRARKLRCDPPSGDHPYPDTACHDLAVAEGDLARLPGVPGKVCSGVYKPVSVTALGEWRGIPVRFAQSYRNACKMMASTGLVFGF